MMKKSVCIILAVLLTATMTACTAGIPETQLNGNYEVYLCSSVLNTDCLRADVTVYPSTDIDDPAERIKTLDINGIAHTLEYKSSNPYYLDLYTYEYATDDGKLSCAFWSDTQELASITLREQDMSVFRDMDQAQYEQWIREFAAQFTDADWDSLTLSCDTFFYYKDQSHGSGRLLDGFHAEDGENTALGYYDFAATKYVDDIATNDELFFQFSFLDNEIFIRLNRGQFDEFASSNLNYTAIENAITTFADTFLQEGLDLGNVYMQPECLVSISNNILLRCYVSITYTDNGISHRNDIQVILDIPDP